MADQGVLRQHPHPTDAHSATQVLAPPKDAAIPDPIIADGSGSLR